MRSPQASKARHETLNSEEHAEGIDRGHKLGARQSVADRQHSVPDGTAGVHHARLAIEASDCEAVMINGDPRYRPPVTNYLAGLSNRLAFAVK